MADPVLELAAIINSNPEFTRRLNDFAKAKKDADEATVRHEVAKTAAADTQRDLDRRLAEHRAAMTAASQTSANAAAEAARRIELANKTAADNDRRHEELNIRENNLKEREGVVELLKSQFEAAIRALGKL